MGDAVAIASVVSTASLGGLALVVSAAVAARDRGARRVESHRDRIAAPYVEILEVVEEIGTWCATTHPIMEAPGLPGATSLPDEARQMKVQALLAAFASDAVSVQAVSWRAAVDAVFRAARIIDMKVSFDGVDYLEAWGELEKGLRGRERAAREQLQAAMRHELAAGVARRWWPKIPRGR